MIPLFAHSAEPPLPEGRRLRAIVAEKYPDGTVYIGGTTGWKKRPHGSGEIVDREFNYVTPENDYKQSVVHPEPGKWNWEPGDAWIENRDKEGTLFDTNGKAKPAYFAIQKVLENPPPRRTSQAPGE